MKKLFYLTISLIVIALLSSCTVVEGNVSDRITTPDNIRPPIRGKWVIDKVLKSSSSQFNELEAEQYIGKEALFHKDAVIIADNYTTNPSFKMKIVNAADYLLYKYKLTPGIIGIEGEKVEVITILNDNTYFYEFIKIDEDTMIVNIDESFYSIKKSVEEVSIDEINRYINVEKSILKTFGAVEDEAYQTGIMIGLKIPSFDEGNHVTIWDYKTIWINSQDNSIIEIYELNQLLMPRMNGFWILESDRIIQGDSIRDELLALPQFRAESKAMIEDEMLLTLSSPSVDETAEKIPSILKNILFLGNDYISVENIDLNRGSRKTLQVYAIDNLAEKKPIKLSDLIGESGKEIFSQSARSAMTIDSKIVANEENIGLVRKNGYWILKGRINYNQNSEELYNDFNIKTIPPKEMVNYDEQAIPWDAVRLIVPDVLDVFSSPNNEFIVVITSSHLVVYYLEDGDIINNPAARIKLPYDSAIIMSEWAVGRYVNIWQNEIIRNGGIQLD
ncbi:hypothetical protein E9840_07855 [Tissierella creatinini]|nr:hypothetical protein E9840_07855 [Tissierella creatinini]TJX66722.1 hypothetical protein E8P77_07010 [Soehngenia saccharolytica]